MSKKKNTLKDLDEFLRQQAATIVPPSKLSDKIQEAPKKPEKQTLVVTPPPAETSIIEDKKPVAVAEPESRQPEPTSYSREQLCDLIIKNVESRNQYTAEDRMLINTALYLKSAGDWKDVIRQYWRNKNNAH